MNEYVSKLNISLIRRNTLHTSGSLHYFPDFCIGYVKKGKGEFLYMGKKYEAFPGDVIYIPKGTRYYSIWSGAPQIEFYSVGYSFADPYARMENDFCIFRFENESLFDNLYSHFSSGNFFRAMSSFYELIDEIYLLLTDRKKRLSKSTVAPAIEYIEKNFTQNICVAALAKLCCLSESRFFAVFKEITGSSPIAYKNYVQVQNALKLLADSDMSIEQISSELGFASAAYFRRVFKKITDKNPGSLRRGKKIHLKT